MKKQLLSLLTMTVANLTDTFVGNHITVNDLGNYVF